MVLLAQSIPFSKDCMRTSTLLVVRRVTSPLLYLLAKVCQFPSIFGLILPRGFVFAHLCTVEEGLLNTGDVLCCLNVTTDARAFMPNLCNDDAL